MESVCPVCLRRVKAWTHREAETIWMEKTCPEHGHFRTVIWNGPGYDQWARRRSPIELFRCHTEQLHGCPYDCGICPAHRQRTCCVLLEVTQRCNLCCPVCFASAGGETKDPDLTEIKEWYELLLESGGSFNIQLSGGEPTMRDDLPEILRMGRLAGFPFFQLNTNGLRLAEDPAYAAELRAAGLDCVFLQFDGLRDVVYQRLRGRALLAKKLRAIESCGAAGLGVVLVPTIVPDVNEGEIGTILQFAEKHVPVVRGVHFQPVSYFGRYPDGPGRRITIPDMLRLIEQQTDGRMKATDFSPGSAENAYCSFHASYLVLPDGGLRAYEKREHSCCGGDAAAARSAVARQWASVPQTTEKDDGDSLSINGFLHYAKEHTIAISGMVFQDAWNLDLDRLKNCYIHVVSPDRRVIPFCAYNLTSADGKPLYREVLS